MSASLQDEHPTDTTMDVDEQPVSESSLIAPFHNVGYVYSVEMMKHAPLPEYEHPELPERIEAIYNKIRKAHLLEKMYRIPIRLVEPYEVQLVHSQDHWEKVIAIKDMTTEEIVDSARYYEQLSLYVHQGTTYSALLSCGGAIEACLHVAEGKVQKSFAIVRPPGHHAEPDEHMGFCFFNNVAVAARVVQKRTSCKKILILDWDVHHGNGTHRAFNDDPSVLYISIHRYSNGMFYPGGTFGSMESCGEGPGLGFSVNIPWPNAGMGDADYIHAFQKIVMPIATEFAPDLVISYVVSLFLNYEQPFLNQSINTVSAGFDAAAGDPLGQCFVSPAGYAHMTYMLCGLAGGRVAVALEGGYDVDAISTSALAVLRVLLGEAPPQMEPLVASEEGAETVFLVAREQSKYWKSVDPKACEPREEYDTISFSIPEILKTHRQHHLYTEYGMLQIPLMNNTMEERFGAQVTCSGDIFERKTMVVLVHEFGNLRVELSGAASCDIELERSYHVDFSVQLIDWIRSMNYSLVDINLFPKPPNDVANSQREANTITAQGLLTYVWDNYIQLSGASDIIFIGHGPGCSTLIELLSERASGIMKSVQLVIQVLGNGFEPSLPRKDSELRAWYRNHSLVVVPTSHPVLSLAEKIIRRHGNVLPLNESKSIKLMTESIPFIKEHVENALKDSSLNA